VESLQDSLDISVQPSVTLLQKELCKLICNTKKLLRQHHGQFIDSTMVSLWTAQWSVYRQHHGQFIDSTMVSL